MKELLIQHPELTLKSTQPKLKLGQVMEIGEGDVRQPEDSFGRDPLSPASGPNREIKNPDAKRYAEGFIKELKKTPFKDWDTPKIIKELEKATERESEAESKVKGFNKDKVAAQFQPFQLLLITELQKRGIDTTEFFLKKAEGRRAMGAAGNDEKQDGEGEGRYEETTDISQDEAEERMRVALERDIIDLDKYPPALHQLATKVNLLGKAGILEVKDASDPLKELVASGQVDADAAEEFARDVGRSFPAEKEKVGFYLSIKEYRELDVDPFGWLDRNFDNLYMVSRQGHELNSPAFQSFQSRFQEAARYVELYYEGHVAERFADIFATRYNSLAMRTVIGYRDIEQVRGQARNLLSHGLFHGLSLEGGAVFSMFNRINELLDDKRLQNQDSFHLTPLIMNQVQDESVKEQMDLAQKGASLFKFERTRAVEGRMTLEQVDANILKSFDKRVIEAVVAEIVDSDRSKLVALRQSDEYKRDEEKYNQEINDTTFVIKGVTRTVRTAYDLSVASQRQAVIASRSKRIPTDEAYFSEVTFLTPYNFEQLLVYKFGIANAEADEYFEELKINIADGRIQELEETAKAEKRSLKFEERQEIQEIRSMTREEKIHLGERLFRDLFAVPDIFSSGWRIKGYLEAIEERIGKEKAKDFGLFLRLKWKHKPEDRRETWGKIADLRPEEVVKLFRERAAEDESYQHLFQRDIFTKDGIAGYDQFKQKYGGIIRIIREKGYKETRQIDFGKDFSEANKYGLKEEEKQMIDQVHGEGTAEKIQEMFKEMSYFSRKNIDTLISSPTFEDIYTRTITVEDALLNRIEETEGGKYTPVSQRFASDPGGDQYVRIWNDTNNSMLAMQALVAFIRTDEQQERYKKAHEFAEKTSEYNGQLAKGKCLRYTIGTDLEMRMVPFVADILGIKKLGRRFPITRIEKIYGPSANTMQRDDLLAQLDHLEHQLVGAIDVRIEDDPNFANKSEKEKREEAEKKKAKAKIYVAILKRELGVTSKDMLKLSIYGGFLAALTAYLIEIASLAYVDELKKAS